MNVQQVLSRLTLEQKVGQLVQYGKLKEPQQKSLERNAIGSFLNLHGATWVNELQRSLLDRGGVPLFIGDDVIHGYRTTFPIPLGLTSSWNPQLVEDSCAFSSAEAAREGISMIFAPMVDISYDPRWGRVAEGAGEDPFLGSAMAAARVKGIQAPGHNGLPRVSACVKHFAGYGFSEGGRDYDGADISERRLRETVLPPFRAAIRAGSKALMCSFNDLAGTPVSANRWLLREVLREEWGFDGVVVSDWQSVEELVAHGVARSREEAARKAFCAGVDIDMNSGCYEDFLAGLVRSGKVPLKELDEAVLRVLRLKEWLGLFENPLLPEEGFPLPAGGEQLALQTAQESIVLLKNHGNLLPLSSSLSSIAVVGPLADDHRAPLGCWACKGDPANVTTVLEGIAQKLRQKNASTRLDAHPGEIDEGALQAARNADVVIAVMGEGAELSGESHNRSMLGLPGDQPEWIRKLQAENPNIVLVLMNGRPLALGWEAAHIPAIVESWHPGDACGLAIADVLFGDFNPSGKLPMTFPRNEGQIPIYAARKSSGRPEFQRYLDVDDTPLFPFAHGLSYTRFESSDFSLEGSLHSATPSQAKIVASATLTNTGTRAGAQIVQLYTRRPFSEFSPPVQQLQGFTKVLLQPGASQRVRFELDASDLQTLGRDFQPRLEPGKVEVWLSPGEGCKGAFEIQGS